jgi:hypothetical protein
MILRRFKLGFKMALSLDADWPACPPIHLVSGFIVVLESRGVDESDHSQAVGVKPDGEFCGGERRLS